MDNAWNVCSVRHRSSNLFIALSDEGSKIRNFKISDKSLTMKLDTNRVVVLISLLMTVSFVIVGLFSKASNPIPDFTVYDNVKDKKLAFFGYMLPLVKEQNSLIKDQRERLLELRHLSVPEFSRAQEDLVTKLIKEYRVKSDQLSKEDINQL